MKPGRELDCEIAEKVLGCKVEKRTVFGKYGYHMAPDCRCPHALHADSGEDLYVGNLAHYSIDIDAAWEVVRKLASSGKYCCTCLSSDYYYRWSFSLTLSHYENPDHKISFVTECDTAPEAICLTALKATAHEKEAPTHQI